jgi:gliding motility-associated lipoprotein GldH
MRVAGILVFVCVMVAACDQQRIYEKYTDFENRYWLVNEKPAFEFSIVDTEKKYNIYSNVRNSVSYPWSRLFVSYSLTDSTGTSLKKNLMNEFLFDASSGEPFGNSGVGDIYDHQFLLLKDYQFKNPGKYVMTFEQYMRTDTLQGILAIGLRVEQVPEKNK